MTENPYFPTVDQLRNLLRQIACGDVTLYPLSSPTGLGLDYSFVDLDAEEIELWEWATRV